MESKQQHTSFLKLLKGILCVIIFLLANAVLAQTVTISSLDSEGSEVSAGVQDSASFTISMIGGILGEITEVTYSIEAASTSTEINDHDLITGTVILIANGSPVPVLETITVNIIDDNLVELAEDLIVKIEITAGTGSISGPDMFTLKINDNDALGEFMVTTTDAAAAEELQNQGRFLIQLDKGNGTGTTVTLPYTLSSSNGATAADYNVLGQAVLTFPSSDGSSPPTLARAVRIEPIDDAEFEIDEDVIFTLGTPSDVALFSVSTANTGTVIIEDNELCPAGTTAPVLNSNPTTLCDVTSVDLNSFVASMVPIGSSRRFSLFPNPTEAQLLSGTDITAAGAGTYYVLNAAGTGATFCTSPSTEIVITFNTSPNSGTAVANLERCNDSGFGPTAIDLDNAINGEDTGGTWTYISGGSGNPGINANNVVNFLNDSSDTYVFEYEVTGIAPCANATTQVSIEVDTCDPCVAGNTPPALNSATETDRCDEPTVNLDTFIASVAPPGTMLRWSLIPAPMAAGDLLNTSTVSVSDSYYAVYWDNAAMCASPSTQVDLLLSESPSAGPNANGAACNNSTSAFGPTSVDLDDLLATGVDPGVWAFTSGPAAIVPNGAGVVQFSNAAAGSYVYTYTTNNAVAPCNNDSAVFTITVSDCDPCVAGNVAPVLNPDTSVVACDEFTDTFNDYTTSTPPVGTMLTWSTSSDTSNTNAFITPAEANSPPTLGGTYYGFFYDATNDCASPTLQINLVLNLTPMLTSVNGDDRCGPGTVVLTATASDNATINWYASSTGGGIIGTGSSFTTPIISTSTSYYAEATLNSCASERQQVIATIQQQPSAGIPQNGGNASACSVEANGPTILDLDDLITGEDNGDWVYTSGPVSNFNILSNNILNFEGRPDGAYVFTYTTTGAVAPCMNESTIMTISVNDCDVDTDLDGLFDGVEATLGTDPNNPDTDGDGIDDATEVGPDIENPLDSDVDSNGNPSPDGVIDAVDSQILDLDNDGVVDQLDPSNDNPCLPSRMNGVCDFDMDDVLDIDDPEPDNPCVPNLQHPNCDPLPIDLQVLKTVDNINGLIGDEVTFTITVNNLSDSDAINILVGDIIESGFEYQSHSSATSVYNPTTGEWNIPLIPALGSETLEVTVLILEEGVYSNTAELLDSFPTDNVPENNAETVTLPIELPIGVNLVLEKRVSLGEGKEKLNEVTGLVSNLDPEVEVIYFIKVINKSQQDVVSNISVADAFTNEDQVDFEITDMTVPANTIFDETTGIWTINRSLEIGQEIELSYKVVFRNIGRISNTAQINRSTPSESMPQDDDSNDMAVVKIATRNIVDVGIIYNQFSPNNDGLNDDLEINLIRKNSDGTEELLEATYDIEIYNRYGNLIFEAVNKSDDKIWNGSWKGKDSPGGTYFYNMNVRVVGEAVKSQKGWIQLIR